VKYSSNYLSNIKTMDKIRIDFFDILGYIIPGSALLMIGWIAVDSHVQSIWHIYQSIHGVDKKAIFTGLFLSYILGFTLHIGGSFLYDTYRNGLFPKKMIRNTEGVTTPEKWTLIREYGEKHIPILERWYALRAFSQNLTAISLICVFICLYKWWAFGYLEWAVLSLVFIASFIVFMHRSTVFHKVLDDDIDSVIKKLKLNEK
jgi:hypothetical protein